MIPPSLYPRLKVMQVIAAALMMGLASFLVIAGFVAQSNPPDPDRTPVVTYLGLFLLVTLVPVSFLLPALATRGPLEKVRQAALARPGDDQGLFGGLLAVRQTAMILGLAPLEAAGFFNAVAFLIERSPLALGGAIGALLAMATRFPTVGSVAAWLQTQKDAVAAQRLRGPTSPGA